MKALLHTGLRTDWKIASITIASTLLLVIDRYFSFTAWKPLDRTILYLVVPLFAILFIYRENPRDYGFQLGDWRAGLLITAISLLVIIPLLWWFVRFDPAMRDYYQPYAGPRLLIYTFVDLFGWEFLFRGWLTFAYVRKYEGEGLWLQSVPFAIAHISKPAVETLSTIFGGFVFGWIAWRTRSFLYPFLIHWAIFTFVVLAAGGFLG